MKGAEFDSSLQYTLQFGNKYLSIQGMGGKGGTSELRSKRCTSRVPMKKQMYK